MNMHLLAFAESIQLFPDGTLFIHIAIILVMIWVLNRTLYKPINRIIEAREVSKGGKTGEAAGILQTVAEKEKLYATELLDARSKGYELIEAEQKKAVVERDERIGETRKEIGERFVKGRAELERQAAEVHATLGTDAEKIAESIAANILKV
jgi:F-type H+-transporting ATPase subunit b